MGSALLFLGMGEKGCIPRERGSPMLVRDQSSAVDSLQGRNVAPVTLPGVNYCGNNCLQKFQVTYVS